MKDTIPKIRKNQYVFYSKVIDWNDREPDVKICWLCNKNVCGGARNRTVGWCGGTMVLRPTCEYHTPSKWCPKCSTVMGQWQETTTSRPSSPQLQSCERHRNSQRVCGENRQWNSGYSDPTHSPEVWTIEREKKPKRKQEHGHKQLIYRRIIVRKITMHRK